MNTDDTFQVSVMTSLGMVEVRADHGRVTVMAFGGFAEFRAASPVAGLSTAPQMLRLLADVLALAATTAERL